MISLEQFLLSEHLRTCVVVVRVSEVNPKFSVSFHFDVIYVCSGRRLNWLDRSFTNMVCNHFLRLLKKHDKVKVTLENGNQRQKTRCPKKLAVFEPNTKNTKSKFAFIANRHLTLAEDISSANSSDWSVRSHLFFRKNLHEFTLSSWQTCCVTSQTFQNWRLR